MPSKEVIRSRSNPRFKRLSELKRRTRGRDGLLLIEGPKLLAEAVAAGLAILEVALSDAVSARGSLRALTSPLERTGTLLHVVDERLIASLSELEDSQGVLAIAREPSFHESAILRGVPLVVVAVGIQNPGNLGGLLRTAEAAGASGAWLSEGCADPLSWKSLRGSMGSAFRLPRRRQVPIASVLSELRERGVSSIATSARAELRYDEADLARPTALLFGSEGAGLPEELERNADLRVRIPLQGGVESLNVGVAAGVLLFEAARQRRAAGM